MTKILSLSLLLHVGCTRSAPQSSQLLQDAITKSREHLEQNTPPHAPFAFPNTRYRLALMLESSSGESSKEECLNLYLQASKNKTAPIEIQISALQRAAAIDDNLNLLVQALKVPVQENELAPLRASTLEQLVSLLLNQAEIQEEDLNLALELCKECLQSCPNEPVVDESMGALLRQIHLYKNDLVTRTTTLEDIYHCFHRAAIKSHAALVLAYSEDVDETPYGSLPQQVSSLESNKTNNILWNRLLKHVLLASCSARKAGLVVDERQHFEVGLTILDKARDRVSVQVAADLYVNIGIHYKSLSEQKAKEFFQRALDIKPNDGHALVHLASIHEPSNVDALDDEYVSGLFDGYSQRFENELVHELNYQGHLLVADAVQKYELSTVIDLGCGTGLLGAALHQQADAIYGIDLSPRMAEISRRRHIDGQAVYKNVSVTHAMTYLQSLQNEYASAVVASDVFIYVGALEPLFSECRRVLKAGGVLCFTVELTDGDSFQLLSSGRFGHSRRYVEKLAAETGLRTKHWGEAILRKQGGENVNGAVVTITKED